MEKKEKERTEGERRGRWEEEKVIQQDLFTDANALSAPMLRVTSRFHPGCVPLPPQSPTVFSLSKNNP